MGVGWPELLAGGKPPRKGRLASPFLGGGGIDWPKNLLDGLGRGWVHGESIVAMGQ